MLNLSGAQWVIYGALSLLWAFFGYRLSENDRKTLGRTPWGLPSGLWAFLWFLSLILGLVLYLIAHSIGVRQAQQNPQGLGTPGPGRPAPVTMAAPPPRAPTAAEQFPAYPAPANSRPIEQEEVVEPEPGPLPSQQTEPEVTQASWANSPPAWHPDPSGRFHYRWWDGEEWTSQVSTDGHHLIDTNPDQRIGPYT